jgi:hypothetical protein
VRDGHAAPTAHFAQGGQGHSVIASQPLCGDTSSCQYSQVARKSKASVVRPVAHACLLRATRRSNVVPLHLTLELLGTFLLPCSGSQCAALPVVRSTSSTKNCIHLGCTKGAIGKLRLCIAHGGGKRCSMPVSARSRTLSCPCELTELVICINFVCTGMQQGSARAEAAVQGPRWRASMQAPRVPEIGP